MTVQTAPSAVPALTPQQLKEQIKSLREEEKKIRASAKAAKEAAKAAKEAAKVAGTTQTYSRVDSISDFVMANPNGFTLDQVAKESNAAYAQKKDNQKSDNEREAKAVSRWILKALTNVGYLTLSEGIYRKV